MKKTLLATAALAIAFGFAATANAKDTTGQPGNGNQHCVVPDDGPNGDLEFKNPGKLFQFARDNFNPDLTPGTGANPKDVVNNNKDPEFANVGEIIQTFCGVPE
jgi:hypothetical protein